VAEANATVSASLFRKATGGNVTAQIFWMKTRGHWREGPSADEPISAARDEPNSEVLVLPDNGRDLELTAVLREAQEKYFARRQQQLPPSGP
jgi:hypothetical protein